MHLTSAIRFHLKVFADGRMYQGFASKKNEARAKAALAACEALGLRQPLVVGGGTAPPPPPPSAAGTGQRSSPARALREPRPAGGAVTASGASLGGDAEALRERGAAFGRENIAFYSRPATIPG